MKELLKNKQFIRATAVFVGTMVGVGVFGIPFAFSKSGFAIGLFFFFLTGAATLLMCVMYGEVVLRTNEKHQLVGYAGLYQGIWAKRLIFFAVLLSSYTALLAYIIVAGEFWNNVLSPLMRVSPEALSFIFFSIAAILVLSGIKTVSWAEVVLACLFFTVILLIFIFGAGDIDLKNFSYSNSFYWFFPYGIFLFAFSGMAAIPIQRRMLTGQEHLMRKSIFSGIIFVAVAYLIFGLTVFGITGEATSPEAINGLIGHVSEWVIWLGSLFGGLAVCTSFLMLGSSMTEVFIYDYNLKRISSWLLVMVPPILLFWSGVRNFIDVIGLAGAVAIGVESAMLIWIFKKSKISGNRTPEYSLKIQPWILYLVAIIFLGGAIYELIF